MVREAKKKRAYGTSDSHVVPHRSTEEACSDLTSQFGRDTVRFTEYGRRRPIVALQESRKAASRADKQKCLRFGPNFCLELFGGVERRVYSAFVGSGGRAELEHQALHWVLVPVLRPAPAGGARATAEAAGAGGAGRSAAFAA